MKSKISVHDRATLASEIATLSEATPADLKSRWRVLYSTEPPPRISRDLLTRAVAYRIQEKALGGLRPSTRRLLAKVAADASARRPIQVAPAPTLQPGTVLLRNWHGTEHRVIVRDRGVEFRQPQTFGEFQLSYRMGDMHAPYLGNAEPLLIEIGHFVSCVETGAKPLTSGEFGAQVVEALELVDRANLALQRPEPKLTVAR